MSKKNKPIGYTLGERKVGVGPNKGKVVSKPPLRAVIV